MGMWSFIALGEYHTLRWSLALHFWQCQPESSPP
jgi:hypothetical protein